MRKVKKAGGENRTRDPRFTIPLLYQLSYPSIVLVKIHKIPAFAIIKSD